MRDVPRIILTTLAIAASAVTLVACSGGGGGTSAPQGPPPPPFAETLATDLTVGLQLDNVALIGEWALVPVSEAESDTDLNGDGDRIDTVAHLLNITTNTAVNLRLAMIGKPAASNLQFAFLVSEAAQGTDLSGDGDGIDAVWHLLDPAAEISGTNPLNSTLSTPLNGRPGVGAEGGLILVVSEVSMGTDFSGDGDSIDDVVFAVEHFGNAIVPLGIPPHSPGTEMVVRDNHVLVCGSESSAGIDLTGDSDTTDRVLGLLSFEGPGIPIYRIVGAGPARAIDPMAYALTDDKVVYLVHENSSGATDLNGDGDNADSIIALMDFQSGVEFFPTASSVSFNPLAANLNTGFATSRERVIFGIDESSEGKDLNTDQDTVDSILAWIDTKNLPSVANPVLLTLGSQKPQVEGTIGLVSVNEAASALVTGIDYNLDGDISDQVAFRVDLTNVPSALRNLGVAVEQFSLVGSDAILMVSEAAQQGRDRNGDGDTNDLVPAYTDLSVPAPALLSLGLATRSITVRRIDATTVRLALLIPEQPLTSRADLNGDGDSLDNAYFWIDLDTALAPARVLTPTPYLIGIGSSNTDAPLAVDDDTILFATSEAMLDRDLSNDGDATDTLLRIVRRLPPE